MSMFRTLIGAIGGGGSILPPAYQQVEYIESTGTQYIDTDVYGTNNTNYTIEFAITTKFQRYQQYFAGQGTQPKCPKIFMNNEQLDLTIVQTKNSVLIYNMVSYVKNKLEVNGTNLYYNDALQGTLNRGTGTDNLTTWIFNSHAEPTMFSNMRLYSLQMDEAGTPIRNFVPCYRKSDNEIGLYDTVNDVFYTNLGTGTFTKGSNV